MMTAHPDVLVWGSGYLSTSLNKHLNYEFCAGRNLVDLGQEARTLVILHSRLKRAANEDDINAFVENCRRVLLGGRVKSIIFISSVAVYGYAKINLFDELSPVSTNTPYQFEKMSMERMIARFSNENDIKYYLLRVSNLFGSDGARIEPNRGFFHFLKKAVFENKTMTVNHGGRQYINFINVYDVCDAIRRCVDGKIASGIYNVASERSVRLSEISKRAEQTFPNLRFQFNDDHLSEINSFISDQKFSEATGVQYQSNFEDEMKKWMVK